MLACLVRYVYASECVPSSFAFVLPTMSEAKSCQYDQYLYPQTASHIDMTYPMDFEDLASISSDSGNNHKLGAEIPGLL